MSKNVKCHNTKNMFKNPLLTSPRHLALSLGGQGGKLTQRIVINWLYPGTILVIDEDFQKNIQNKYRTC